MPAWNKDDFAHALQTPSALKHLLQKSAPQFVHDPEYNSPISMIRPQTSQTLVFLLTHVREVIAYTTGLTD
jgi:hypothetical protein